MTVGFLVLAAADVNPVVVTVDGFEDELVEVCVRDEPVEPLVEDLLVGVGKTV